MLHLSPTGGITMKLSEIEQRINLHVERHKVLSSNIANVDTPDYKAKDIDFSQALNKEKNQMAVTHEKHIGGAGQPETITRDTNSPWKDGNDVELNTEIAHMSENQLLHDFFMDRFAGYVKKFKMIISTR